MPPKDTFLYGAKDPSGNNRADFEPCQKLRPVMKAVTHLGNFRDHCRSPVSKIERLFPDGPIKDVKCCRCGKSAGTHKIKGCSIQDATVRAVGQLISSTKALKDPRQAQSLDDHMVGGLIAMTSTGQEIKIMAVSGPAGSMRGVHNWIWSDIAVPRGYDGFWDIYGRDFNIPTTLLAKGKVGMACAAIKLLMKLGEIRRSSEKSYDYNYIYLYEEAVRAQDADKADNKGRKKKGKSATLKAYRGKSSTFIYAAHSCDACEKRIPLLLCSNPL